MNNMIENYNKLSLTLKRDVLINEMVDLLNTIELIAKKRKIDIEKLSSEYYIKNKDKLFEEDYYNLMFIYITYLKEDLALML